MRAPKDHEIFGQFTWEISSIDFYLGELRYFWAKALSISSPQWLILMALANMDKGEGVSVKAVSKMLHVDSSFVTTQSKMLEKLGFLRRKTSEGDARIVQMSLTDKAYKRLASLASRQESLNDFIFSEFNEKELVEFTAKLKSLKGRIEKACLRAAIDI
jgi:DNA-binding MarR family transcriptional regulator